MIIPVTDIYTYLQIYESTNTSDSSLILYHGTDRNFNKFDIRFFNRGSSDGGWLGYGFYLTNDIDYAKSYGDNLLKCEVTMSNRYIVVDQKN